MIVRVFVVAAAAVLAGGAPAEAGEGWVRLVKGPLDIRASIRLPHRQDRPHRVWVPGHYEVREERVFLPGCYRVVPTPAEYQVFIDRYGGTHRILVKPAGTRRVWVPARYRTIEKRVWVPGRYETRRAPTRDRDARPRALPPHRR